jgi:DNA transformation protein
MNDTDLLTFVLDRLQPLPITSRSMFGGKGLYFGGTFFGVIFDGVLYFRTDGETRAAYIERGMAAYQPTHRPRGPKTVDRNFQVPPDILADPALLCDWALRAAKARR